jgi:tRNA A37 threonylcarbamoyladenosine modification protein TsaB
MEIRVGVTYVSGLAIANDFEVWIDDARFIA